MKFQKIPTPPSEAEIHLGEDHKHYELVDRDSKVVGTECWTIEVKRVLKPGTKVQTITRREVPLGHGPEMGLSFFKHPSGAVMMILTGRPKALGDPPDWLGKKEPRGGKKKTKKTTMKTRKHTTRK